MNLQSDSRWTLLIASLPGANNSLRMRLWRGLKACGAATLRDGVYLLPDHAPGLDVFRALADEVVGAAGSAKLLPVAALAATEDDAFRALFDRSGDYAPILAAVQQLRAELPDLDEAAARRRAATLRRDLAQLTSNDFFAGAARAQAETASSGLETALNQRFAPDEPQAVARSVPCCSIAEYRGRRWATRARLWVDRVACAWLIRRFIDPAACFLWLSDPDACPVGAVGFDFDGAEFSHCGNRVTFETLLAAFGLEADVALARVAALVHYLDVGGVPVPEAAGFAAIIAGARANCDGDDELLEQMSRVLDHLHAAHQELPAKPAERIR